MTKQTRKRGIVVDNAVASIFPIKPFEKQFEKQNKSWFNKSRKKRHNKLITKINAFYNNTNIKPENDFYNWVNKDWLKSFKVSSKTEYIVEYDDFRLVQDKVYRQLFEIIETYLKTPKRSDFKNCLNTFYKSSKTFSTVDELRNVVQNKIIQIDGLMSDKDNFNLWKLLGKCNQSELNSYGFPLVFNILPDDKEPSIFRPTLNGPLLYLVDSSVYFDDGTNVKYKANYRKHYYKYVRELFDISLGKGHNLDPRDVFQVQVKLFNAFGCMTEKEEPDQYNKITKEDALSKYQFDWEEFCKALGFTKVPDWFITNNVNYLKCCTALLLKEWNTPAFRTYFIFNYIRQISIFCKKTREVIFQFRGKFERGEIQNYGSQGIDGIFALGLAFNTFLSNQYIAKYKNDDNINYLRILVEDLKQVYVRIIHNNTWLSQKTKNIAALKLNKMNILIGSPRVLRKDPVLPYTSNFIENLSIVFHWKFKQLLLLNGASTHNVDIPSMDWNTYPPKFTGTQAYVVNASYTPSNNSIYVPLGYIQKPFIDIANSIEHNLAYTGFTLGHEMSHSLDDFGSKYDHTGRLYDWWKKEDNARFKRKQNDVLEQYKTFAKRDGIIYDVEYSLGEDMADISGLEICTEYLANLHTYKMTTMPIRDLSFQQFFIMYAYQMRQKIFKKALSANLKTNPHPIDKYRTNIPLSRSLIFRKIFNITDKNKMWWHNTDTIW